ncbi:MAG TPA: CHRD domain-containing protein [Terriglobales bacterium]|nr:CHRD domain-containing protein [Terriglobales bacterium]
MKSRVLAVVVASALLTTNALAQTFSTRLKGQNETPVVFSGASGHATITITPDGKSIQYELTYSGLEGSTGQDPTTHANRKVLVVHIHVGRPTITGGVVVFFCGGGNTPTTQAGCPASAGPGTGNPAVTGTWTAADVTNSAATQGIEPVNPNGEDAFARFVTPSNPGSRT